MSLPRYVLRRVLGAVPTLLLVVVLAFALVRAAPGGPFDEERALPADVRANIEAAYHLDEPLLQQFLRYAGGLLRGDLGPSYRHHDRSVNDMIADAFPLSAALGLLAMGAALVTGVGVGAFAALGRDGWRDRVSMAFALTGISVPVFVVAPVLILVFAVHFGLLPAGWSGNTGIGAWILPVVALALPQIATIARLTRASLIDVFASPFIRTARAQGLGVRRVVRQHALKPALLPILSYLGPALAGILTGSVVVEQIFGIPGIGQAFVRGALDRDYTLVLGVVILYATLIIGLNLLVDVLYGALDPRVRHR